MSENGAYEQIEQRILVAVDRPRRLRAIAEDVNEGRVGWDTISDRDIAEALVDLHRRGYVIQRAGGWWQRTTRGLTG